MNPTGKAVLVPPRPNLGPEPMPGRPATAWLFLIVLLVAGGAVALLKILRSRGRPRAARALPLEATAGPFASRRDQMIAWSAAAREALAARSGPQWRARTTEEIAAETSLAGTLGDDLAAQLVGFLTEADRAKFDDRDGLQPPLPGDLPGWLAAFVASSSPTAVAEAAAGARSRINGK